MTTYWPDVSNNNWHTTSDATAFTAALPGEGFAAVCHKVSEGNYYRDPYWPAVLAQAKASGLIAIGYHYVTTDNAHEQALTYLANCVDLNVPCMLDFEANSGNIDNYWNVWNTFAQAGINVRLSYIPHWYWQQIGSPTLAGVQGLVSSSYYERGQYASVEYNDAGADSGQGWTGYGGANPIAWQFTDSALIAGLNVDCNAYRGDVTQLRTLLGIPQPTTATGGTPVTTPTPPAPDTAAPADPAVDADMQLRGPDYDGWPQLGDRSVPDALGAIGAHFGIPGFIDTKASNA